MRGDHVDQCARPACRHAPPPHSPRVAALRGAPPAEPFAPPACPHRTRCTPLRCALRCTTSERASRATETQPLAPGRRRRSRRASSAELCSARTLRSARSRGSDVGAWLHRTAQVYPFLPPRRSPGLILSLDGQLSFPPPPQKNRRFISFAVACWRLGCVPLLRPRQPRLASRLDRSHKACATCVAHRFRAVAAADIVRRRSSSSWCVSGGSLLATSASCSDGCMPH